MCNDVAHLTVVRREVARCYKKVGHPGHRLFSNGVNSINVCFNQGVTPCFRWWSAKLDLKSPERRVFRNSQILITLDSEDFFFPPSNVNVNIIFNSTVLYFYVQPYRAVSSLCIPLLLYYIYVYSSIILYWIVALYSCIVSLYCIQLYCCAVTLHCIYVCNCIVLCFYIQLYWGYREH